MRAPEIPDVSPGGCATVVCWEVGLRLRVDAGGNKDAARSGIIDVAVSKILAHALLFEI
jgi:hypothetical protein